MRLGVRPSLFSFLTYSLSGNLALRLYQSGLNASPIEYSKRIRKAIFASTSSSVFALGLLLLAATGAYSAPYSLLLAVGALAAASWLIPASLFFKPLLLISKRRVLCERELPFFTTYLAIAASSGVSLQATMDLIRHSESLPGFRQEADRVEKVRRLYAIHPYDAMVFEARHHPSERVKDLYLSVVAAQRQGDTVPSILRDELMKVFSQIQGSLRLLTDKFSVIASAEMVAFIMLPMGILTIGAVFSSIISLSTLVLACIGFPTLSAVLLSYMVDSSIPRELTSPVSLRAFSLSMLSFPTAALVAFLNWRLGILVPLHYTFGFVLLLFLVSAAIHYAPARKESNQILSALPSFTRLVAEEAKKGVSPGMSLVRFSESHSFNRHFDRFLHRISAFLKVGAPISVVAGSVRFPWVVRAAFELIDEAERLGAEPKSLDHLSELVSNLGQSMRALSSQTRFFAAVSYVNTVVLTFTTVIAVDVVGRLFVGALGTSAIALPFGLSFMTLTQFELTESIAYLSVIYDAFLLGLVGGKLSRGGSVADGLLPGAVSVALALLGIFAFRELGMIRLLFGGLA
ncbi:MAG: type II secretion system F family protein [Candidatus Verstraetearchaeota archaeon]|nr:type II secretion system F family protein [Candidatus Verstraetearchaeota archaeon]